MRSRHRAIVAAAAVLATMLSSGSTARAGGAQLWEIGTPDVGLAAAGWAARAEDAATVFKNPAGMSLLDTPQLELGLQATYGRFEFSSSSATTVAGDDGGNAVGLLPGGSVFWAQPVHDRVAIGVGVFSYIGSALNYDSGFVGRYHVDDTALIGLSFMPAVSVRLTDWLTLGAGFHVMVGLFNYEVAVNNPEPALDDGRLEVNDTDVGFGANAGILAQVTDRTRIGATYLSPVKLGFSMPTSFTGLGAVLTNSLGTSGLLDATLKADITVPQSVVVSVHHAFDARWAVMGNVGWQDWSRFGLIGIDVASTMPSSLTLDRSYKDTAHVAIGARYRPVEPWIFSTGFAYDSSSVGDANRTLDAPMGQSFRFGVGGEWQVVPAVQLGLAYTLAWFGDMPVDQTGGPLSGDVAGSFERTALHVIMMSLIWHVGATSTPPANPAPSGPSPASAPPTSPSPTSAPPAT